MDYRPNEKHVPLPPSLSLSLPLSLPFTQEKPKAKKHILFS
jgi:hypothetical protein